MSTAPSRARSAQSTPSTATPSEGAAKSAVTRVTSSRTKAEPSLRFHHPSTLRKRSEAIFKALEESPDDTRHGAAMADLVAELVQAGMDYYFFRGLQAAQVGFLKEQSARLGISGAVQLVNSVSRKFIVNMDSKQLLAVAQHIRSLG